MNLFVPENVKKMVKYLNQLSKKYPVYDYRRLKKAEIFTFKKLESENLYF